MLNIIMNTILNDVPKPWGLSKDTATATAEGIIELHDTIMFYMIIVLC